MGEELLEMSNMSLNNLYCTEAATYTASTRNIVSAAIMVLFLMVTIVSNFIICFLFCSNKKLRLKCYHYVISLAISDILIATCSMPLMISFELTGLAYLNCRNRTNILTFIEIVDIICCVSAVTNLTAISMDRSFGALRPLKHRMLMTRKKVLTIIAIVWVYSICLALVKLLQHFYNYIVFVFVLGFALPLTIIILSYGFIFFVVVRKSKNVRLVRGLKKERMMITSVVVVVIVFSVCWGTVLYNQYTLPILSYMYLLLPYKFS